MSAVSGLSVAPMPTTHLLYLHGFRSSPLSTKARHVAAWVRAHRPDLHWHCPQLPPSPRQAMASVFERVCDWPPARMAVIGSSLGGFYATAVAERTGCRAVLLNPAVDAARIRAFFVAPGFARRGVGAALLTACEGAAAAAGFTRTALTATLPGVPLYRRFGYVAETPVKLDLRGVAVTFIPMNKQLLL